MSISTSTAPMSTSEAILWLEEVCAEYGCGVLWDQNVPIGCYDPDCNWIELEFKATHPDREFVLQVLLHETIHVLQHMAGQFKAEPVGDRLYIASLDKYLPYQEWYDYIHDKWGDAYGAHFEDVWTDEVAPVLLEESFQRFYEWYENYRRK